MGAIGPWQIAIVFLVILFLFGATRLPKIGRGLGQGLRDFKRGITGEDFRETRKQLKDTTDVVNDVSAAARRKTL